MVRGNFRRPDKNDFNLIHKTHISDLIWSIAYRPGHRIWLGMWRFWKEPRKQLPLCSGIEKIRLSYYKLKSSASQLEKQEQKEGDMIETHKIWKG